MIQSTLAFLSTPPAMIALLAAAGLTLALYTFVAQGRRTVDPMAKLRDQSRAIKTSDSGNKLKRPVQNETALTKRLDKFRAMLEPKEGPELDEARREMVRAGYHGRNAVRDFHAAKFALGLSGLTFGVVYTLLFPAAPDAGIISRTFPIMVPTLIGYYAPIYWVGKRRKERQDQITRGFPDALDMLLICAEAGQSMDQSIKRVSEELRAGYPALAEEFETVAHETKAGKDRMIVLRELGERCGNNDIKSFATVLIQSATYGTSVAEALRVYAGEMRDKRVMLAEEKANVLPTKLTLGTMMFTVPPLLIILIGPSVYGVMTMLATADFSGGGG